jgi:metallopeptidase MepB
LYIFNLAISFRFRNILVAILLFTGISLVLAPNLRVGSRLTALLSQVKPHKFTRPITSVTMAPERYQNPPQAPPSFTATTKSLVDDAKHLCDRTRKILDDMVKDVKPEAASFGNIVLPMAVDENESALSSRILGFYQAVSTDKELRDASTEAEKLMDDFSIEASMREDIYELVEAAFQNKDKLDPESQRLLDKERKSYIRNGLGIEKGPKRDRFKEIKKRLSQIAIQFQKNLNEENGGIWLTPKELDGVPQDLIDTLEKGKAETENEGKVKLSFKYPDLFPTLKFAFNAELRQKLFIENENKVSFTQIYSSKTPIRIACDCH